MRRLMTTLVPLLVLAGACSEKGRDQADQSNTFSTPPNQPSQSGSPTSQLPAFGAPKVDKPLDISYFQHAPCDSLTTTQVRQIFGADATPEADLKGIAGPQCSWHAIGGTSLVVLTFPTLEHLGLTGFYRAKGNTYKFFAEMSRIDNYPTIAYGATDDRATNGECAVAVGTSDQNTLAVNLTQSAEKIGRTDPCDVAHQIAAWAMTTIKGRQ